MSYLLNPILALVFSLAADPIRTETVVPMGNFDRADVSIELEKGDVVVEGGTQQLVRALFNYPEGDSPRMKVKIDESIADVTMQGRGEENKWNVLLSGELPVSLDVDVESGKQRIVLESLKADRVKFNGDTGEIAIDGAGEHPELTEVDVELDEGKIKGLFPGYYTHLKDLSFEGKRSGITLDLSGNFGALEEFQIRGGGLPVDVQATGTFAGDEKLSVSAKKGKVDLNLNGRWKGDSEVNVETTSGDVVIHLPETIGVVVKTSTATGQVGTQDLKKTEIRSTKKRGKRQAPQGASTTEEAHVNDAYQKSPQTLTINVRTTSGNISFIRGK